MPKSIQPTDAELNALARKMEAEAYPDYSDVFAVTEHDQRVADMEKVIINSELNAARQTKV